jgi:Domain of unknown function (DUF4277)
MAVAMQPSSPVAHWPVGLGVVRQLNVATLIEAFCPPHPAPVLAWGRGVEALLLAILDGPPARYQGGARLEARGLWPLLQPGLARASLHDDRLGQLLDALVAAPLTRVCGALALHALEVYARSTPWRHQETTPSTLSGADEAAARRASQSPQAPERPVPPRPASGHRQGGRKALKPGRLRRGGGS